MNGPKKRQSKWTWQIVDSFFFLGMQKDDKRGEKAKSHSEKIEQFEVKKYQRCQLQEDQPKHDFSWEDLLVNSMIFCALSSCVLSPLLH